MPVSGAVSGLISAAPVSEAVSEYGFRVRFQRAVSEGEPNFGGFRRPKKY